MHVRSRRPSHIHILLHLAVGVEGALKLAALVLHHNHPQAAAVFYTYPLLAAAGQPENIYSLRQIVFLCRELP